MGYVLASLALSLALSPSHSLTQRETPILNILPSTSSPISSPNSPPPLDDRLTSSLNGFPLTNENINFSQDEVDYNEVQVNLIVNQLAILRILNGTKATPDPESQMVEALNLSTAAIQNLGQEVAAMRLDLGREENMTPLLEALEVLRENQTALWDNVGSPAQGQAAVREVLMQQKDKLAILENITSLANESPVRTALDTLKASVSSLVVGQGTVTEVLEEMREKLAFLFNFTRLQGNDSEEYKRELQETQASLLAQGSESEVLKREVEQLKDTVANLNDAVTLEKCDEEGQFHVNDNCSLIWCHRGYLRPYQVNVGELQEPPAFQQVLIDSCFAQKCDVEGEHHVNDNCSISMCQQGNLRPYQGSSATNVSFSELLAKSCIHLDRNVTSWDTARNKCLAQGGDLFVAGDFSVVKQYLKEQLAIGLSHWPWVGGQETILLDGRIVAAEEWKSDFPNLKIDNGSCIFATQTGLADQLCTGRASSLCHKGVSYQ